MNLKEEAMMLLEDRVIEIEEQSLRRDWLIFITIFVFSFSIIFLLVNLEIKVTRLQQVIDSQEQVQEETQINTPNCLEVLSMVQEIGKEEISENKAISLMIMLGIEHPHIVYAQMRLESGNFTSSLARDCNNFFGMKHPKVRTNVSLGANSRGFATYDNWAMSVLDYGLWQRRYASGLTEEEYYGMLSNHYAEDSDYCTKVSNIISNIDFNFYEL